MIFLARKTLLRIGLHRAFVDIIMTCTTSISYSFLMNGTQFGLLQPSWGIRQGDPLSPHLFICVVEAFLALIRQAEHRGDIFVGLGWPGKLLHYYYLLRRRYSLVL